MKNKYGLTDEELSKLSDYAITFIESIHRCVISGEYKGSKGTLKDSGAKWSYNNKGAEYHERKQTPPISIRWINDNGTMIRQDTL